MEDFFMLIYWPMLSMIPHKLVEHIFAMGLFKGLNEMGEYSLDFYSLWILCLLYAKTTHWFIEVMTQLKGSAIGLVELLEGEEREREM